MKTKPNCRAASRNSIVATAKSAANDNSPATPPPAGPAASSAKIALHHGDCLANLKALTSASVHLVIFDPPYGTTACRWDKHLDHAAVIAELERVLAPLGTVIAFGSDDFSFKLRQAFAEHGRDIRYRYSAIWMKNGSTGFLHKANRLLKQHEDILVFSKGLMAHAGRGPGKSLRRMTFNPQGLIELDQTVQSRNGRMSGGVTAYKGRHADLTYLGKAPANSKQAKTRHADCAFAGLKDAEGRTVLNGQSKAIRQQTHKNYPTTIYTYGRETRRNDPHRHPTKKPLGLVEELVRTYSNPGEVVLDPTMGSGTTGVACRNSGRSFIGIEREAGYFQIASERILGLAAKTPSNRVPLAANDEHANDQPASAQDDFALAAGAEPSKAVHVGRRTRPRPPLRMADKLPRWKARQQERRSARLKAIKQRAAAPEPAPKPLPSISRKPRVVDLYCGVGGLTLGFEKAGFEVVAAVDCWDAALDVYRANFKHPAHKLDLSDHAAASKLVGSYTPDVIVGGPPCTDYSAAGKQRDGAKAALTLSFAQIVCAVRPSFFVMENVERARKSTTYENARSMFRAAGYGLTEQVLDASLCGVPQKRRRLILIGKLGTSDRSHEAGLRAGLACKPMSVHDYLGDELSVGHYYQHPRFYDRRAVFSIHEPAPTIRGTNRVLVPPTMLDVMGNTAPVASVRGLNPEERARIQTFPASFRWFGSRTVRDQMVGNAVPVELARYIAAAILGQEEGAVNDNGHLAPSPAMQNAA